MSTLDLHTATAELSTGLELAITSVEVTLDENWEPYCQARITAAMPDDLDLDLVDIRSGPIRVQLVLQQFYGEPWNLADLTSDFAGAMAALTATYGGDTLGAVSLHYFTAWNAFGVRAGATRIFDLAIISREIDHVDKELSLSAASDEALLQSDALVATTAFTPASTDVRTLVSMVLDRIDANLQPGAVTSTVEADATVWQPGISASDYLDPLLQSSGLRLWCDGSGRWWLTEAQPSAPGSVVLSAGASLIEASDSMDVKSDSWFDAVVITYEWTTAAGVSSTQYDVAGSTTPRNVYRETVSRPYPGPGAAAGILHRAQGRGRVLQLSAVSNYAAQPGMTASIGLPGTDTQTGYVSAVTWSLPQAEMTIGTRGLVDTPPTSWLAATGSWASQASGASWTSE